MVAHGSSMWCLLSQVPYTLFGVSYLRYTLCGVSCLRYTLCGVSCLGCALKTKAGPERVPSLLPISCPDDNNVLHDIPR